MNVITELSKTKKPLELIADTSYSELIESYKTLPREKQEEFEVAVMNHLTETMKRTTAFLRFVMSEENQERIKLQDQNTSKQEG